MDVNYFKYAIEIYECGSINKAAQHLQLSQPNLSVCIKNLESELGFEIFSRTYTGIYLTEKGELFLNSAKKIVTELEAIDKIPTLFSNKENISLSCTYSFDIMNSFIQFKRKYPQTAYEDSFKETGVMQTIRDVIEQRYRMTLFYCFHSVSDTYYQLAQKHHLKIVPIVKNCPWILLSSKKNPLAKRAAIPFREIKDCKLIMYENFKFDEWLKILGFENDDQILYIFDRGGLIDMIKQSRYVTVMMKRYTDVYSEDCVEIPILDIPCGMDMYLMYQSSYTLNQRERLFIKELKKVLQNKPLAK